MLVWTLTSKACSQSLCFRKVSCSSTVALRKRLPPLAKPATQCQDSFIRLETSAEKIDTLFDGEPFAFIRAGVATGKTTLALHLARTKPEEYLIVPTRHSQIDWVESIVSTVANGNPDKPSALAHALEVAANQGKTLIFDEAHLLFTHPSLVGQIFKDPFPDKAPRILLFSAASQSETEEGTATTTPAEITRTFMWYPPMASALDLVQELESAGVVLDSESVDFFLKMCGGHRGIFMAAMHWVKSVQQKQKTPWDFDMSVAMVSDSLRFGWDGSFLSALQKSRAIKVNGMYSDLKRIPDEFVKILVEGATEYVDSDIRRKLTVHGFLQPECERSDGEFVQLQWDKPSTRFGVSNPLMASYYQSMLKRYRHLRYRLRDGLEPPLSCIDLLARAFPHMSFHLVVGAPTRDGNRPLSCLSADQMPYEDNYAAAIHATLKMLGYTLVEPQNPSFGKVDVYVITANDQTYAIEVIMSTRSQECHNEHRQRFNDRKKINYSAANFKCLLTIGDDDIRVRNRVNHTVADGVEIVGIVVAKAHDSYTMYVKRAASTEAAVVDPKDIEGQIDLPCDGVSRAVTEDMKTVSAQKLSSISDP